VRLRQAPEDRAPRGIKCECGAGDPQGPEVTHPSASQQALQTQVFRTNGSKSRIFPGPWRPTSAMRPRGGSPIDGTTAASVLHEKVSGDSGQATGWRTDAPEGAGENPGFRCAEPRSTGPGLQVPRLDNLLRLHAGNAYSVTFASAGGWWSGAGDRVAAPYIRVRCSPGGRMRAARQSPPVASCSVPMPFGVWLWHRHRWRRTVTGRCC
jgi:hypothetical protein